MNGRLAGKRILVLSSYHSDISVYWAARLGELFPEAELKLVSLPPQNFAWRVRGAALRFIHQETAALNDSYDLLLVTSHCDLATLRGLSPALASIPTVLCFLDNPFALAEGHRASGGTDAQMNALYAAECADQCWFNSRHNLTSFMSGVAALLDKQPDEVPAGVVPSLLAKSVVLPIPLSQDVFDEASGPQSNTELRILWNHRWGFEKGPERLLAFAKALGQSDLSAKLVLVGPRNEQIPMSMAELIEQHADLIAFNQPVSDRQLYKACLVQADVVLSTARQDFQGIDVMEAAAMGCVPLLPDRLSYPEYFPELARFHSVPDADQEATNAVSLLRQWVAQGFPPKPDLQWLKVESLVEKYQDALDSISS